MIQVNLGSGRVDTPLAGWFSLDRYAWPVKITAELSALPFGGGSVQHLHCSHVVEHVPLERLPGVFAEIRRVLDVSGILYCSGPDMDRTTAIRSEEWAHYTRKGGVPPGWEHQWVCGVKKLRGLLVASGFVPTWCAAIPTGWPPNIHSWPHDLEARFLCRRDDYVWPRAFPAGFQVQT